MAPPRAPKQSRLLALPSKVKTRIFLHTLDFYTISGVSCPIGVRLVRDGVEHHVRSRRKNRPVSALTILRIHRLLLPEAREALLCNTTTKVTFIYVPGETSLRLAEGDANPEARPIWPVSDIRNLSMSILIPDQTSTTGHPDQLFRPWEDCFTFMPSNINVAIMLHSAKRKFWTASHLRGLLEYLSTFVFGREIVFTGMQWLVNKNTGVWEPAPCKYLLKDLRGRSSHFCLVLLFLTDIFL